MYYPVLICPSRVPELLEIKTNEKGVIVGAAVTLTDLQTHLQHLVSTLPLHQTRVFQAILEMLRWFAGPQIRNVSVSYIVSYRLYIVHKNGSYNCPVNTYNIFCGVMIYISTFFFRL